MTHYNLSEGSKSNPQWLKVYTGEEIKLMPDKPTEFWVDSLVAKNSKTLVVGKPKCGKSFYVIQLALCLATGSDFLGFKCERCKVLYLPFEGGERQTFQRIKTMAQFIQDKIDNLLVLPYMGEPILIDTNKGYQKLKSLIDQHQPNVVIIDPKRMTMEGSENNAEDNRKWCANLDKLIQSSISFVIVHHSTKKEWEDLIDRPSGSNILSGWAEIIVGLEKEKSKKDIRIMEVRTRFEEEPEPLKLQFNGFFSLTKEEEVKRTTKFNVAKEMLKRYKPLNLPTTELVRKVAEEFDIHPSYVWRAYSELFKSNLQEGGESRVVEF